MGRCRNNASKKEYIGGIYAWLQLCKLKHVRSDQRVAEKWE